MIIDVVSVKIQVFWLNKRKGIHIKSITVSYGIPFVYFIRIRYNTGDRKEGLPMITFISPTKNMKPQRLPFPMSLPQFCVEAEELLEILKTYNDEDIMQIMKVNAKLAIENQQRFQAIRFDVNGTHALSSYDGLAFKYMNLSSWNEEDFCYANEHLRILSGFYGVVKPFDSIYPYRLEMQAQGLDERIDTLYSFWNDELMCALRNDNHDGIYINLASKEYSQAVTPYLFADECCINLHFKVIKDGKPKILATAAKMARGRMVAYMMKNKIQSLEGIQQFQEDGWKFMEEASTSKDYVFIQTKK